MLRPIYYGFSILVGLLGWPIFYWRLKSRGRGESFGPRLGLRLPPLPLPTNGPRLWLHGVSVGEISAAEPLVHELQEKFPDAELCLSTGTETGQAVARKLYQPPLTVFYYPLDLPWAVQRYLKHIRPDLFIVLETEIWPNFLHDAHRAGVRLALANARLSDHSFRRYLKIKSFIADIINYFELIAASSAEDARRFLELGAEPKKIVVTGSTKWDRLVAPQDSIKLSELRQRLGFQDNLIFLAASTHPGEEKIIIQAFQSLRGPYPALLLILTPRHPERAPAVGQLLAQAGLPYHFWSKIKQGVEGRRHPVIVVDTIGELFPLYGLADLVFVGGSLVPHGGQNILEAAAWGKFPLYGPHMENFRLGRALLEEAGAGQTVYGLDDLIKAGQYFLAHPNERQIRGQQGQTALQTHQGAARRQAQLFKKLLLSP
ncbi:MAG: 3-deoxy-D-manno-octulosonic acid transferase [Deltaproteobacteria bacterium]|nr:3-deoxy-D-manno-octulosonic acid transferase [Deltaproteobacteria bacterium]MBW1952661.1 3-deoxy-D-manno-octulosonic acid transferase [Deltaproteobacteria bacterium]MBW1986210.1 3-deoxy-D-manno-octulosonic acid transferase [Deltaproteobacteria bacterium]MBW2134107.1 3-deoxy-D-manno-octulosonic acid transferase [Deltaproteobacteria bacterium]